MNIDESDPHAANSLAALEDHLASRAIASGEPTGWFDRLYSAGLAGDVPMPWDRTTPNPLLVGWAQARTPTGSGHRAIVVGCGLGADAEYVAGLGYHTVAFDVAAPLAPPPPWLRAFDLVIEIITVQALPDPPRRTAIINVGRLVAPGGTLLVIAARRDQPDTEIKGPPWPLDRDEIDAFATDGLHPVRIEELTDPRPPTVSRWRAEFRRPR